MSHEQQFDQNTAVDFVIGLAACASLYIVIGLQKLLAGWLNEVAWSIDIVQLDLCAVFVICCSLLSNGLHYTLWRSAVVAVVASAFELLSLFGPLTFSFELGYGPLPFRVPILWVFMFTNSHSLARLLGASQLLHRSAICASLMTLGDLVTDPLYSQPALAGHAVMKLWDWRAPPSMRTIHGVPLINFFMWWVVAFVSALAFELVARYTQLAVRAPLVRDARLPDAALCGAVALNGVFFMSLRTAPTDTRLTAVVGMLLPAAVAMARLAGDAHGAAKAKRA